jgi:hypothetical protein
MSDKEVSATGKQNTNLVAVKLDVEVEMRPEEDLVVVRQEAALLQVPHKTAHRNLICKTSSKTITMMHSYIDMNQLTKDELKVVEILDGDAEGIQFSVGQRLLAQLFVLHIGCKRTKADHAPHFKENRWASTQNVIKTEGCGKISITLKL